MRPINEIKADIALWAAPMPFASIETISKMIKELTEELVKAITDGIPLDRLETIMTAEKDGRLAVLTDKIFKAEMEKFLAHSQMRSDFFELLEAKMAGRCRILPCNVGDTVYDRFADAWEVTEIDIYDDEKILARCGHKGTDDYCALYSDEIFLTHETALAALNEQNKP